MTDRLSHLQSLEAAAGFARPVMLDAHEARLFGAGPVAPVAADSARLAIAAADAGLVCPRVGEGDSPFASAARAPGVSTPTPRTSR